jgi:hypothetical protein
LIFKKLTGLEKPKSLVAGGTLDKPRISSATACKQAMDLSKFIRALVMVGSEVYAVPVLGYETPILTAMISNTLAPLDKQIQASERGINTNASSQISKLLEILQDESIVDLLSVVHKTMLPFYSFYANSRLQMNSEGFQKFCVDFGIFPDILSKPKIFRFFKTLANFYQETKLPGQ